MSRVFQGVCDVCSLVDGDETEKPVICCGMCSAHLCGPCSERSLENLARRGKAWMTRGLRGLPKRDCK